MDETSLRELDDRLRDEVPGTAGWGNDPAEFADYTFDELQFDPATYLVAVNDERHQFAGLVRIWANGNRSRLGLVGVARPYRRRGLARAMLASALRPVHERGVHEVMAEVDASNTASLALLRGIGAVEIGSSMVLRRRLSNRPHHEQRGRPFPVLKATLLRVPRQFIAGSAGCQTCVKMLHVAF